MINKNEQIELSIVLPCLNEEQTVGICVAKAVQFLKENKIMGEVIVADNGSMDSSIEIAKKEGAVIAHVEQKGYGMALRGGFTAARGKYIIMADSDDSYDLVNLMAFVEKLREGYDLVMGIGSKAGLKREPCPGIIATLAIPSFLFLENYFSKHLQMIFIAACADLQKKPLKRWTCKQREWSWRVRSSLNHPYLK